jgi:hypothetical protein
MRKVLIGTPTYDGKLSIYYVNSLINTLRAQPKDTAVDFLFIGFDALVQRARNDVLASAIMGEVDDLVFIDADQAWEPSWFYALLEHKVDVVGITYPKKTDNETYPVNCASHVPEVGANGLILVDGLGTGFLRLSKKALQYVWERSQPYIENGVEKRMAFNVSVENRDIVSEDINFCRMLKELGVYLDPRFTVLHVGSKVYTGDFGLWLSRLLQSENERLVMQKLAEQSATQVPVSKEEVVEKKDGVSGQEIEGKV